MGLKLANNALSRLSAGISPTDTSIVLVPGGGAAFPTLGAGDYFPATIVKTDGTLEIIKVTARATDVLTVVRAQENTTAKAFSSGDRIELRMTAGTFAAQFADQDSSIATLNNLRPSGTELTPIAQWSAVPQMVTDNTDLTDEVNAQAVALANRTAYLNGKLQKTIFVTNHDIGSGSTDDRLKLQTLFDNVSAAGGGEIIFDSNNDYLVSDNVNTKSNLVLRFTGKGFIKLTNSSTSGGVLNIVGTSDQIVENVRIYNPRIDGNNLGYPVGASYGENGIAGSKCRNVKVFGGVVKNCRRGASNPIGTGGKAVQFEDGVDDIIVDGVTAMDCTLAMETGGLIDIEGPYQFRRNTGVLYTNMKAIRCERLISFQQTLSPPSTSVKANSAVVDGVLAIDCGREVPLGTELNFGLIVNDRASNCIARNIHVFNSPSYGKVSAVIKQHRGTNCEYDVTFFGECDDIVSHGVAPGVGGAGLNTDSIFTVRHVGTAAYAVNGLADSGTLENLYIINTDVLTSGLIGPNLYNNSELYGRFVNGTKGKSIEGPFNTIVVYFANNYASAPTAFAGEFRVNGITLTLTSGAHKITSVDDLIFTVNGSDKARFNALGPVLYGIPTYADNAEAGTAGLGVGQLYKTPTGQLMIKY